RFHFFRQAGMAERTLFAFSVFYFLFSPYPVPTLFEHRRAVLNAAGVAYLLSGFLLSLAAGTAWYVSRHDSHRAALDWVSVLAQRAAHSGLQMLGGLLLLAVALCGLYVALTATARARRLDPGAGALAALFLSASMLSLATMAVWTGVVETYLALQFESTQDALRRQALLVQSQVGEKLLMLGLWCLLAFAALGLYFLGRALRGERGWLPVALKLAAVLILLHLPMSLYVWRASLVEGRHLAWLAALDRLLTWGGLAAACYFCGHWLRRLGRTLPD
ncbi:MAG: hypothetical protein ACRD5I_16410, partial [Candidatus Acidiferrales bacterium]